MRDMPEWLEEFTKNVEDEGVLVSRSTPANASHDSEPEPSRKVASRKHSIYTHFPKDRNCEICKRTKITWALCTERTGDAVHRAEKFGDLITADHRISKQPVHCRGSRVGYSMVAIISVQKLLRRRKEVHESFSSRRKSLKSFVQTILWNLANPVKTYHGILYVYTHRSDTNGIAGRAVRRRKEVTYVVLMQPGLDETWWGDSVECHCHLRNIEDLLSAETLYQRRFGEPFKGTVVPFGSMVECHPISAKDLSRLHQFGKKS